MKYTYYNIRNTSNRFPMRTSTIYNGLNHIFALAFNPLYEKVTTKKYIKCLRNGPKIYAKPQHFCVDQIMMIMTEMATHNGQGTVSKSNSIYPIIFSK